MSPDLIKVLQSADVRFGNFEGSIIEWAKFGSYPAALGGGSGLLSPPEVANDLKLLGFNLASRANNHATDFGTAGMLSTDGFLDSVNIVHAGTGSTLPQARAPQIQAFPADRISLVAITSRFEDDSPASDPLEPFNGRPGVNPLHTTRYVLVSPEQIINLRNIQASLPSEFAPKNFAGLGR